MQIPAECQLHIEKAIDIDASPAVAFEALLEQLGPGNETPHGPMPMKLEAWPGGRWWRDLGKDTGHLWARAGDQSRRRCEISGPLFMSYPAISHVQIA